VPTSRKIIRSRRERFRFQAFRDGRDFTASSLVLAWSQLAVLLKEPKPFNWADTVLGIIGWIAALSIMGLAKH